MVMAYHRVTLCLSTWQLVAMKDVSTFRLLGTFVDLVLQA